MEHRGSKLAFPLPCLQLVVVRDGAEGETKWEGPADPSWWFNSTRASIHRAHQRSVISLDTRKAVKGHLFPRALGSFDGFWESIVHAGGQKTVLQLTQQLLVGRKISLAHSPHEST
jgi:hypothetical protein